MTNMHWRSGARWPSPPFAVALLALLVGCGGGTSSKGGGYDVAAPGSSSSAPTPAVVVAFAAALPDAAFSPLSEAPIASTASVWVVADWTSAPADGTERLVLTGPDGSVYYAPEIPLADTSTSLVHVAALPDGTRRAAFQLLIWGTTIETYAETGTWTAAVTLLNDGTSGQASLELR